MRQFDVRLKLDDVIASKLIMSLLFDTIKKLPVRKVLFWHNGDISDGDIDNFLTKWREITNVTLEICDHPKSKYVWFEIISKNDDQKVNLCHTFKYIYSNIDDDIMKGIFNYSHTIKIMERIFNFVNFITAPKKKSNGKDYKKQGEHQKRKLKRK